MRPRRAEAQPARAPAKTPPPAGWPGSAALVAPPPAAAAAAAAAHLSEASTRPWNRWAGDRPRPRDECRNRRARLLFPLRFSQMPYVYRHCKQPIMLRPSQMRRGPAAASSRRRWGCRCQQTLAGPLPNRAAAEPGSHHLGRPAARFARPAPVSSGTRNDRVLVKCTSTPERSSTGQMRQMHQYSSTRNDRVLVKCSSAPARGTRREG